MDSISLLISVITGAIGLGYFVYGKRESHFMALVSGLGLCLIPYLTDSIGCLVGISLLFILAPFVFKF